MTKENYRKSILKYSLLCAFIMTFIDVIVKLLIVSSDIQGPKELFTLIDISIMVGAVFMIMMILRQLYPNQLNFSTKLVAGWLTCLLLGLIVALYDRLFFFQRIELIKGNSSYFAQLLVKYNIFGLIISAIFAFVFNLNRK